MAKKKTIKEVVQDAVAVVTPTSERQQRWNAFVAAAEAQATKNGTLHIFKEQQERGELDTPPADF